MKLVIIVLAAYSILASATDYYKYTLLKKKDREIKALRANYRTIYQNVKRTYGWCVARRVARPLVACEAQMFKLEPHTAADDAAKSIEVIDLN